jgi:heme/copper-type cytochrome/quinol oxidase subunit 3
VSAIPWSYDARPDTRTSNVRLGIWLFLASEAMLFGSLFSGYVLLRSGSASWPDAESLNARHALMMTPVLLAATVVFGFGRATNQRARLIGSSVLFAAFAGLTVLDYQEKIAIGLVPSTNLLLACWFTITAVHALHVGGGIAANLWAAAGLGRNAARDRERFHALRLFWYFVDFVWLVILVSFYLV